MSKKPISSSGERGSGLDAGLLSREDWELSEETVKRRRGGALSETEIVEKGAKVGRGYNMIRMCMLRGILY